ncbi:MAG: S46 family peptidase [Balneolaceae bacterium]|nr:S46 family peptidase [Balneolaceae bacterium]
MRIFWFLFGFILLLSACISRQNFTSDLVKNDFVHQGFPLTIHTTPFDSAYTGAVAKLYRGNSFVASGAFISESGLFLTTYDPVLNLIANEPARNEIMTGFSAESNTDEIPIPGMSLLVLIEEKEVTELYSEQIPDSIRNNQINSIKQQITQRLIEEAKGGRADVLAQVSELLAGNRQILSVYKIINDLRLVWSDSITDSVSPFAKSNELRDVAASKTSIIRAYIPENGVSVGYNQSNQPYKVSTHFDLPSMEQPDQNVYMFGFPNRTFRNDSYRAFKFYNTIVNPAIINSYSAYQKGLDEAAETNANFSYQTIYDRFNVALQVQLYEEIQDEFKTKNILELKNDTEFDLRLWATTDTTIEPKFRDIFSYIDQAFDIAEQNGASFYITSYSLQFGKLDDLANLIKNYNEETLLPKSDAEIETLRAQIAENQRQLLGVIDLQSEISFLSDVLITINSLPEAQSIPSVQQLFMDVDENNYYDAAKNFLERQTSASFLFDVEETQQAIANDVFYQDSLFTLLDEILFVNDMNRNNHAIYLAYNRPAQQVFLQAKAAKYGHVFPDANGTLRYNKGYFRAALNKSDSEYLLTYNDFRARSPGSIIFNKQGEILGLTDHTVPENLIPNYLFNKENAYYYSLDVRKIAELLKEEQVAFTSELFE